jgi:hypothetical protein
MLSGTESEIINYVAQLKEATKDQIRRQIGFSLDYTGFLCQYLVRRDYLTFAKGHYSLAKEGIKTLLSRETPRIERELLKEVAGEVAKEISSELKKTVKGIKISVAQLGQKANQIPDLAPSERCGIKIKTDFELPTEDESLALESNINKIGAKLEREKSDIDKSVELFKEIQKRGKKR